MTSSWGSGTPETTFSESSSCGIGERYEPEIQYLFDLATRPTGAMIRQHATEDQDRAISAAPGGAGRTCRFCAIGRPRPGD